MRLISMNIWGVRGDWAARRGVLAAGLRELNPDLLSLQETIVRDDYDQVRELVGEEFHLAHQTDREPDGQGVSIASRWPITGTRELDLQLGARTAGFAATTLIAEIDAPTGALLLANHFPSWKLNLEAERQAQAVLAARTIEQMQPDLDAHVIVAGDLDADPTAGSVGLWTGHQALEGVSVCYRDAWDKVHPGEPGHTYLPDNPLMVDGDWPFRRIDYVLVRCGVHGGSALTINDCQIIFDAPRDGVQASDHFGLVADLQPRQ
jgi:endonuclease/exonuclease/phosphatase family metal-dependent hydrolase